MLVFSLQKIYDLQMQGCSIFLLNAYMMGDWVTALWLGVAHTSWLTRWITWAKKPVLSKQKTF
jgi:hypothetical protein